MCPQNYPIPELPRIIYIELYMNLMRTILNPESHEPELDWPITREDALDILSLISFLYRQVDKKVFYAGS